MTKLEKEYEIYKQLLKALKEAQDLAQQLKKEIYFQKKRLMEALDEFKMGNV